MTNLDKIRKNIDEIDTELIKLYEKRLNLSKEIVDYKMSVGKKIYDEERELKKLEDIKEKIKNKSYTDSILNIFTQLMSNSRMLQYAHLEENKTLLDDYKIIDGIKRSSVSVAFQGEVGAYSHIACMKFFDEGVKTTRTKTWEEAVKNVLEEKNDFAVVPIENSTAGSVTQIYDLLFENELYIVAEILLPIDHCLLGIKGATLSKIKNVYSHSQALMQCRKYLSPLNLCEFSTLNTAYSAKLVKEKNEVENAAIASKEAAKLYGLEVLEENINDLQGNTTRFVILSKKREFERNAQKISLIFETKNEKGTLYNILGQIVYNGLNMTKIESRPLRKKRWDSRFFIDFYGNLSDKKVRAALRGIYEESKYMRLVGNY